MFLSIFKMMLNAERCSVLPDSTVFHVLKCCMFSLEGWRLLLWLESPSKRPKKKSFQYFINVGNLYFCFNWFLNNIFFIKNLALDRSTSTESMEIVWKLWFVQGEKSDESPGGFRLHWSDAVSAWRHQLHGGLALQRGAGRGRSCRQHHQLRLASWYPGHRQVRQTFLHLADKALPGSY